jgi:hypothetical protein
MLAEPDDQVEKSNETDFGDCSTLAMRAGGTIAATSVVEESPDSTGHDAG